MIYRWKNIVKNSVPLLTICIVIEIMAGQILQGNQKQLLILPILLVSIPVINGVGGNIGSILGARLASGLHVGYIEYSIRDKNMHKNLAVILLIGTVAYAILAVLIYYISYLRDIEMDINILNFISIVLGSGVLLIITTSIVSVITAFLSFKKGLDPDDMVAPVVTTIGDTMGIIFLFLLIEVVGI